MLGARFIEKHFGIETEASSLEISHLPSIDQQLVAFGIPNERESFSFTPKPLKSSMHFGNTTLEVLKTPGHSPGHVTFYDSTSGVMLCGDVLFKNGMGPVSYTHLDVYKRQLLYSIYSLFCFKRNN